MKINKKTTKNKPSIYFERIYQYSDGTFLPDSSQPNPNNNWEITTGTYTPHDCTRYINVKLMTNQKRGLPVLYTFREDCCGCTACYATCPVQAIIMRTCEEGFLYPVVDAQKCLRCYKCLKVCPIKIGDADNCYNNDRSVEDKKDE